MEMFEFAIKFAFWAIKNFDLFLVFAGVMILVFGTATGTAWIGYPTIAVGAVIFALRKGWIKKLLGKNKQEC